MAALLSIAIIVASLAALLISGMVFSSWVVARFVELPATEEPRILSPAEHNIEKRIDELLTCAEHLEAKRLGAIRDNYTTDANSYHVNAVSLRKEAADLAAKHRPVAPKKQLTVGDVESFDRRRSELLEAARKHEARATKYTIDHNPGNATSESRSATMLREEASRLPK